jgi:hypothetical protein
MAYASQRLTAELLYFLAICKVHHLAVSSKTFRTASSVNGMLAIKRSDDICWVPMPGGMNKNDSFTAQWPVPFTLIRVLSRVDTDRMR